MVWSCGDGHSYTMDTGVRETHGDTHNHLPITSTEENSAHNSMEQTQSSAHSHIHAEEPNGETQINLMFYVNTFVNRDARVRRAFLRGVRGISHVPLFPLVI